jgi:hypothetical protein
MRSTLDPLRVWRKSRAYRFGESLGENKQLRESLLCLLLLSNLFFSFLKDLPTHTQVNIEHSPHSSLLFIFFGEFLSRLVEMCMRSWWSQCPRLSVMCVDLSYLDRRWRDNHLSLAHSSFNSGALRDGLFWVSRCWKCIFNCNDIRRVAFAIKKSSNLIWT